MNISVRLSTAVLAVCAYLAVPGGPVRAQPAAAPPAHGVTLEQALRRWTGLNTDVIGAGPPVRVVLPHGSVVPEFSARAVTGVQAGDAGWRLTDIAVPSVLHLADGAVVGVGHQQGTAWLGGRDASVQARLEGLTGRQGKVAWAADTAVLAASSAGGQVALSVQLAGVHAGDAALAGLLPSEAALRGHTTAAGATALAGLARGVGVGAAPLMVDSLTFALGPAAFSAHGSVTLRGPRDREGTMVVSARRFGDLTRALQADGRAYTMLMILRQMGQKQDGALTWTVTFAGAQVLVNGLDVSVLFGG